VTHHVEAAGAGRVGKGQNVVDEAVDGVLAAAPGTGPRRIPALVGREDAVARFGEWRANLCP
jgi:hypothetical protein